MHEYTGVFWINLSWVHKSFVKDLSKKKTIIQNNILPSMHKLSFFRESIKTNNENL